MSADLNGSGVYRTVVARRGSRIGNAFGRGGRYAQATAGTLFEWPRGRHSAKPEEFFALVERLSPGPYLEMYARRPRAGWSVFGNDAQLTQQIKESV